MPDPTPTALDLLRLRTRRLTDDPIDESGDFVLCWLMQALRADENPTIDAAVALGNRIGKPVVVLHTLDDRYPYASHRLHRFILEASQELGPAVEARGLRYARYVRRAGEASSVDVVAGVAQRACAVVVDDQPLFVTREYADAFAGDANRAVLAVDACCLVPMNTQDDLRATTKAFRAAHTPLRTLHVETDLTQSPNVERFSGELDLSHTDLDDATDDDLDALIARTGVDLSVPPAPDFRGHRSAGLKRLSEAIDSVVPRYKWTRNNPAVDGTAKLSPWMHFGVLSPIELARAVYVAERETGLHSAARWKFLDEALTWREYHYHNARHQSDWARYAGLPDAARDSLDAHADDPRPQHYTLCQLVHGQTDDDLWNAAQKQFLALGWMHNNLRMYWASQILAWRPDPWDAFATTCYLNDRLSLDGRDPATYGGVRWAFGDSKPWRDRAVYGTAPRKTSGALMKRDGVADWIEEMNARDMPTVDVPQNEAEEANVLARYR